MTWAPTNHNSMIHLRTRPDSPPVAPAECGIAGQATLFDIPTYQPHLDELCPECLRVRRERTKRK